jgi:hypothetical protein
MVVAGSLWLGLFNGILGLPRVAASVSDARQAYLSKSLPKERHMQEQGSTYAMRLPNNPYNKSLCPLHVL